ncbi:MAG: putative toxin-antitoxin system toxin component, PIN family [Burkholderiales bacterium]|nr:putative toxin-antitoxin system toxin component, PIN family [Burkholderiales bacterium]
MTIGAVIDTNVVLDWLVFDDAQVAPLVRAVTAGDLVWHATAAMREELVHVLRRPALQRWRPDLGRALRTYDANARLWVGPTPAAAPIPRCRDADDQMFLDLAIVTGARWLVSHDRALLALARRARRAGLAIVTPSAWAASAG